MVYDSFRTTVAKKHKILLIIPTITSASWINKIIGATYKEKIRFNCDR